MVNSRITADMLVARVRKEQRHGDRSRAACWRMWSARMESLGAGTCWPRGVFSSDVRAYGAGAETGAVVVLARGLSVDVAGDTLSSLLCFRSCMRSDWRVLPREAMSLSRVVISRDERSFWEGVALFGAVMPSSSSSPDGRLFIEGCAVPLQHPPRRSRDGRCSPGEMGAETARRGGGP